MTAAPLPPDRNVRVALIGCGRISGSHVAAIDRIHGLDLVAASDVEIDRARALAEVRGIPAFRTVEELLAGVDCDVVAICTPSGLHPAHGILAARACKHVVTEKPMAISLADADALVQ
ncbi:MAG: Gfo/Idh/MocA family oxidoreductase, partial [Gemmatimonadota bacterium]|nr:Gfo/Idh/MocA family oxidoreductase [Gemmatimonadota bacterium]